MVCTMLGVVFASSLEPVVLSDNPDAFGVVALNGIASGTEVCIASPVLHCAV